MNRECNNPRELRMNNSRLKKVNWWMRDEWVKNLSLYRNCIESFPKVAPVQTNWRFEKLILVRTHVFISKIVILWLRFEKLILVRTHVFISKIVILWLITLVLVTYIIVTRISFKFRFIARELEVHVNRAGAVKWRFKKLILDY